MGDWSLPSTLATQYADFLTYLKARDVDAMTLQVSAPSNLPTGAIKWNRGLNKFQEWDGAVFNDMIVALAGGGTGSATAAGARTNLGLGSMSVQDSTAVAITGGTIAGVTMSAAVITSGTLALARGGTGASLTIGANGTVMQSNGAAVVFGTDGSALININASQLSAGTVPDARFPATLPAASGVNLTAINATQLLSGTVPDARFPATLPILSGVNLTNLDSLSVVLANNTWTPADASGAALTLTGVTAIYKKIGKLVYITCQLTYPVTADATFAAIGGLPFAPDTNSYALAIGFFDGVAPIYSHIPGASTIVFYPGSALKKTNADLSGRTLFLSGWYSTA